MVQIFSRVQKVIADVSVIYTNECIDWCNVSLNLALEVKVVRHSDSIDAL